MTERPGVLLALVGVRPRQEILTTAPRIWESNALTTQILRARAGVCAPLAALLILVSPLSLAQQDPGLRGGMPGAGKPLGGLTPIEMMMFTEGQQRAIQLEAVCDDCTDVNLGQSLDPAKANVATQTNSSGLGTRFNGDQCTVCHNQPALGGSGGFMVPTLRTRRTGGVRQKIRCLI